MADDEKAELIAPQGTLQSKVTVGGPGAVDPATLERAEAVIADLADDYLEWVQEDLARIQTAYEALKADPNKETLDKVFQIAHDMKGQGGSFGFDLMTAVGNQLCRLSERVEKIGPREVSMVQVHIDAMRAIITNRMKGDGGAAGGALLDGLAQIVAKIEAEKK